MIILGEKLGDKVQQKVDKRELHEHRLTTVDKAGHRVYVHPEEVSGVYKNRRLIVYIFLVVIYIVVPWIRVNGQQMFLLNLPERKFVLFGQLFWGHDAPFLLFFFGLFVFLIAVITAIWGRIWCGWACPQTVFIDVLFRKIETLVEGNSFRRKSLDLAPWSTQKIFKRALKHFLYGVVSWILANTFLAYFIDTRTLIEMVIANPLNNQTEFIVMLVTFGIVYFNFGWFREQFCTIACPYGRFQGVFMDEHSLVVAYDSKRGEPRKGIAKNKNEEGDCVNCFKCVSCCPAGIDIRRGTQFECIACTMCIDACDKVMAQVKRPRGLIKYTTERSLVGKEVKNIRGRTILYSVLILATIVGLVIKARNNTRVQAIFVRGRTPYQVIELKNGEKAVINHFKINLSNQSKEQLKLSFIIDKKNVDKGVRVVTPLVPFRIKSQEKSEAILFIKFPKKILIKGKVSTKIRIFSGGEGKSRKLETEEDIRLLGPRY